MLPLTHVCAQDVSFQTFLSELEKSECIDSVSFGKSFDFINDAELYSKFLPQANEKCRCAQEIYDGKREVMLNTKTFTLQRYCSGYQDGNSQWFMENDGTDYVLITYS